MVAEIEADMATQLARVREMERNGDLTLPGIDYNLSIWSAGIFFHRCLVFLYNLP